LPHNDLIMHHFGLRRSGTHAIIEWFAFHEPGFVGLTNSVMSCPVKTFKSTHFWRNRVSVEGDEKEELRQQDHYYAELNKNLLIISYEDFPKKGLSVDDMIGRILEYQDSDVVGTWGRQIFVPTLRSIYNLAASRMAISESRLPTTPTPHGWTPDVADWWLVQAEADCVLYDRWYGDLDYRRELEDRFGLAYCEEADRLSAERVANRDYGGHGSSFDRYSKLPTEMAVLQRWFDQLENPAMQELLQRDDVRERNHELFGWTLKADGTLA
jgi:hypothetical protein